MQCNVGNKTPVKLCSLNPRLAEMCHLEIELEEDEDVLFSVLGQSSVHLSGYYLHPSTRCNAGGEESESYGEDVGESDTAEEDIVSDDSYESDFIDDGDVCSSPDRHKKEAVEKQAGKGERRKHLKKKNQVDSTDDNNDDSPYKPAVRRKASLIFDSGSEDEDYMLGSYSLGKKDNGKVSVEIKPENVQPNGETVRKSKEAMKRKHDAISQNPAPPKDVVVEAEVKLKLKKNKKTSLETEDGKQSDNRRTLENGLIVEDLSAGNIDAPLASNTSKVYINYIAMLHDGKTVESNVGEKPYKFKLGAGKGKPGWDDGICGMRVGDKRRLTVPPSMLNGHKSAEKIPKGQSAIYEVELVKVR